MKHLSLLFFALVILFGCTKEETLIPAPEKCNLAITETLPANVLIHVNLPVSDTITFSFLNPDHYQIQGRWIDGQIDWECIGFTRRWEDFELKIWTDTDTCYFTIPALNQ